MSKQFEPVHPDYCWYFTMMGQVGSPFEEGWEWGDVYAIAL
jgi:hypothetical protein